MKLTFYGACQQVTGSCYLLEHGSTRILVDCGMVQGTHFSDEQNHKPFPFNPSTIDYVFVTHAHMDHTGRLPQLIAQGFAGQVVATAPTLDFAQLLLVDSAHVLAQEAELAGHPLLYTETDVARLLSHFRAVEYHQPFSGGDFTATWYDAGHILGSGFIKIEAGGKTIVFSGDIGNPPVPLLKPTELLSSVGPVDYVVMESTYGNKVHENSRDRKLMLASAIYETITMKGVLLIPAFAIERTQELLYELNGLVEHNEIPKVPIFIDSPLAIKATRLYPQYNSYFNTETKYIINSGDDVFNFPGLELTETVEASKYINTVPAPKIIIAGSGMMQGGRIRHHLKRYLGDYATQVLIIGYQVAGSLGRQLLDKEKHVMMDGKRYPVKAKIKAIGAYSAHADQPKLLHWLGEANPQVKHIWLTHGEVDQAQALAAVLVRQQRVVTLPTYGQVFDL